MLHGNGCGKPLAALVAEPGWGGEVYADQSEMEVKRWASFYSVSSSASKNHISL